MSVRLVIPAGADPAVDGPRADVTWATVAVEAGCDSIEFAGSAWCVTNGIDGLGICTEAPVSTPPPDAPAPGAVVAQIDPAPFQAGIEAVVAATTLNGVKSGLRQVLGAILLPDQP